MDSNIVKMPVCTCAEVEGGGFDMEELARAAIAAMLEGVEPVAYLFEHKDVGTEFSFDPIEQIGMSEGWTEAPLYDLTKLRKEAGL